MTDKTTNKPARDPRPLPVIFTGKANPPEALGYVKAGTPQADALLAIHELDRIEGEGLTEEQEAERARLVAIVHGDTLDKKLDDLAGERDAAFEAKVEAWLGENVTPPVLDPLPEVAGVDPVTGRANGTPIVTGEGVTFMPFEAKLSPYGAYIVRKGDLWWSARCIVRDGYGSDNPKYGVLVTCRDRFGNDVVWERGTFIYPANMAGAAEKLWEEACRLATKAEADALRRARMGMSVRACPTEKGVTLFEEPGKDEMGVRRAGQRTLVRSPSPRDSMTPFGHRPRPSDPVLMPRKAPSKGLSSDVRDVVEQISKDVGEGKTG